ncbi:MAG TPA: PqqD family protein [Solirubrobacterales bacterium]
MGEPRYRISPEIVHEEVDGEVIAIDLGDGSYYSIAGSGPAIWELLVAGASEAEIGDALAARHGIEPGEVAAEATAFLAELEANGLAVRGEEGAGNCVAPALKPSADGYEPPRLEHYTDMKDYFLLDPIHEVDPAGWPKPAA